MAHSITTSIINSGKKKKKNYVYKDWLIDWFYSLLNQAGELQDLLPWCDIWVAQDNQTVITAEPY